MDGYKMTKEGYEQYLAKNPNIDSATKEQLKKNIKALEPFLGTTEEDRQQMFDTGAFNDICKAYFVKSMKNCNVDSKIIDSVLDEFKWLLDTCPSGEVVK